MKKNKPTIKKAIAIAIPVMLAALLLIPAIIPSNNADKTSVLKDAKLIPEAAAAEKPAETSIEETTMPETSAVTESVVNPRDIPLEEGEYRCYRFSGCYITADGYDYTFNVFNLATIEDNDTVRETLREILMYQKITIDTENGLRVFLNGEDVALTLIGSGVSKSLASENAPYFDAYKAAENAAKEARIGIWAE